MDDPASQLDPVEWYKEKYGEEPRYDLLFEALGKTQTERQSMLEDYFIPSDEDKEEGRKIPTKAHESIADLIKGGYIKVVLTTNFDDLLEQALVNRGIKYQVLATEEQVIGSKPLIHSDCTIIKINGDFRSILTRNTTEELEVYGDGLKSLMKDVFEDFGLVISGWSATWDSGIRELMYSVQSRRYSWYWNALYDNISPEAKELLEFRDGTLIPGDTADSFFSQIKENVEAIEMQRIQHTDEAEVIVNKTKKYIKSNNYVDLNDLLIKETNKIIEFIKKIEASSEIDDYHEFITDIITFTTPLGRVISLISYYGEGNFHSDLIIKTFERLSQGFITSGLEQKIKLQHLPLTLVFYAAGLSYFSRERFRELNNIFYKPSSEERMLKERGIPLFEQLCPSRILGDLDRLISSYERHFAPQSKFLSLNIYEMFVDVFPTEAEYQKNFDLFELTIGLKIEQQGQLVKYIGMFHFKMDKSTLFNFFSKGKAMGNQWDYLQLFQGEKELTSLLHSYSETFNKYGVLAGGNRTDYTQLYK